MNGHKYFSGRDVSPQHLETCWICARVFSLEVLAKSALRSAEAWQKFESEDLVRCRMQAMKSVEERAFTRSHVCPTEDVVVTPKDTEATKTQ
jgi:hypothetical protein